MKKFSSDLNVRRLQYQELLVMEANYSYEEVAEMSLRDLRQAVDEVMILTVTEVIATANGVTKRVRKIA